MRILAIESATWQASVACVCDASVLAVRSRLTRGEHAAHLLPMLDEVMQEAELPLSSLDAVAVSIGPGSFTGLRVGLSLAKGIAYALGLPVIPVGTLEALATAAPVQEGIVAAVLDARRGELYAQLFAREGGRCIARSEELLISPEALRAQLPREVTIIGDAAERYGRWFAEQLGPGARVLPFPEYGPNAVAVAQVALAAGRGEPPETIEPRYLRASEAEEKLRRKHHSSGPATPWFV